MTLSCSFSKSRRNVLVANALRLTVREILRRRLEIDLDGRIWNGRVHSSQQALKQS